MKKVLLIIILLKTSLLFSQVFNTAIIPPFNTPNFVTRVIDFDNDGDDDIIGWVTHLNNSGKIFRNDGNNIFTDVSSSLNFPIYNNGLMADFDKNGFMDVYYINGDTLRIMYNNGTSFSTPSNNCGFYLLSALFNTLPSRIKNIKIGDVNNDGVYDIVINEVVGSTSSLKSKNGIINCTSCSYGFDTSPSTQLITRSSSNVLGIQFADIDNDFDFDLLIADGNNQYSTYNYFIYLNSGGTFTQSVGTNYNIGRINGFGILGEFNNDGKIDIVSGAADCCISGNLLSVFFSNSGLSYTLSTTAMQRSANPYYNGASVFDLNLDKKQDIIWTDLTAIGSSALQCFINNGNNTFTESASIFGINYGPSTGLCCPIQHAQYSTIVDFNNDNKPDIDIHEIDWTPPYTVTNTYQKINTTTNKSVKLKLEACTGLKEGWGARIKYKCGGTWSYQQHTSYASSGYPFLYLGMGTSMIIDSLVVNWFGGSTTVYTNIPQGSFFTAKELLNCSNQSINGLNLINQDSISSCQDSVTVTAVSGMNSYLWSNGKTTASFFAKSSGWYKVTATNSSGCSFIDSIFISLVQTVKPVGNSIQYLCDSASINDLIVNGSNLKWYASDSGSITLSGSSILTNGHIYYSSQTLNGCESKRLGVGVIIKKVKIIPTKSLICIGDSVQLNVIDSSSKNNINNKIAEFNTNPNLAVELNYNINSLPSVNFSYDFWFNVNRTITLLNEKTGGVDFGGNNNQNYVAYPGYYNSTPYLRGSAVSLGSNGIVIIEHSPLFIGSRLTYPSTLIGWHHCAVVYQNNSISLYLDGNLVASRSNGSNFGGYGTLFNNVGLLQTLALGYNGRFGNPSSDHFTGKLDEYRHWSVALTPSQISQIYNRKLQSSNMAECNLNLTFDQNNIVNSSLVNSNLTILNTANPTFFSDSTFLVGGFMGTSISNITNTIFSSSSTLYNYLWSTNDTSVKVDLIPNITKNYWVQVSNGIHSCSDTITITVNPKTFSTITQTICEDKSFLGRTTSGTYIDTLVGSNSKGCDSIRTLNLTVNPKTFSTINQNICEGESFLGKTNSGTYIDTLVGSNSKGCDSIRTLNLTLNLNSSFYLKDTLCFGDTINGKFNTGLYVDTLKGIAANGCDSVIILDLFFIKDSFSNLPDTIIECQFSNIWDLGYLFPKFKWFKDSFATKKYDDLDAIDDSKTIYGIEYFDKCKSPIKKLVVIINKGEILTDKPEYCEDDTVTFTFKGAYDRLRWFNSDTNVSTTSLAKRQMYNFVDFEYTGKKCRIEKNIKLKLKPKPPIVTGPITLDYQSTVGDINVDGENLIWYNDKYKNIDLQTIVVHQKPYYVSQTVDGCESDLTTINILIDISKVLESIYINNSMSPNGDGILDAFTIDHIEKTRNVSVQIINRWGESVFESKNYKNNWFGLYLKEGYSDEILPDGVYYYNLEFEIIDYPERFKRSGYIYIKK